MTYCFNCVKSRLHCKIGFHDLYGFDFMVDDNMKVSTVLLSVWLTATTLEVCVCEGGGGGHATPTGTSTASTVVASDLAYRSKRQSVFGHKLRSVERSYSCGGPRHDT